MTKYVCEEINCIYSTDLECEKCGAAFCEDHLEQHESICDYDYDED